MIVGLSLFFIIIVVVMALTWRPIFKKKRALFTYSYGHVYGIILVFLIIIGVTSEDQNFLAFSKDWMRVAGGLLLGIPLGLIQGIARIRFNILPRIQEGGIIFCNGNNKIELNFTVAAMIIFALFLFDIGQVGTFTCDLFHVQWPGECLPFWLGAVLGYMLGKFLCESAWIVFWEAKHNSKLYLE